MTKDQEINILREFAAKLGPNSYFGPVLIDQLDAIIREIRADMPPALPTAAARSFAAEVMERAEDHARNVRESANREAERIVSAAHKRRENIMAGARIALEASINSLR
jgi:cell division septum initiation protein DivIVA